MVERHQPEDSVGECIAPPTQAQTSLVDKAKRHPEAFGDLYELHYSAILNYFLRRTLDVLLSEELTSEVFFKSLKGLPGFRNKVPIRAWLYRIAANELKMHWRRKKVRNEYADRVRHTTQSERIGCIQPEICAEEEFQEKLKRHMLLLRALDKLPERYREALVLRYFEGLPYAEISLVLNKRPGTVKSLVHRGLAKLKACSDEIHATF